MLILHKIRLFFASRSTILFFKVLFVSLPIVFGIIYFIFYSDFGLQYLEKRNRTRPLIDAILYEPISHNSNAIYPPAPLRALRPLNVYEKPEVLWEGTALEPLYELPRHGTPRTPRGN